MVKLIRKSIIVCGVFLFGWWEYIAYHNHLFYSMNLFLALLAWFIFIYSFFGLAEFERKERLANPIKFKLSILYLLRLFIRGIKIKFKIIKLYFSALRRHKLRIGDFLLMIVVLGISLILVRYFRSALIIEVIWVFNIEKKLIEGVALLSLYLSFYFNQFINELRKLFFQEINFNYLLDIEIEEVKIKKTTPEKNILEPLILKMRRVTNGLSEWFTSRNYSSNIIKKESELSRFEKDEKILLKLKNGSSYLMKQWFFHQGDAVHRNNLHLVQKDHNGFVPFDKWNPKICKEFLKLKTAEENMIFLHKYGVDMNQCFSVTSWRNPKPPHILEAVSIVNNVTDTITNKVIPYLDENTGYFRNLTEDERKKVNGSHVRYEIPHYIDLDDFFLSKGLFLSFVPSLGVWGEPDIILEGLWKDDPIQFGQIKYRADFSELKYEMNQSMTKYEKTDWCIYITEDLLLIEEKIYDNRADLKNRQIIGLQQHTYPRTGQNFNSNLNLTKRDLSSNKESVIQMRDRQFDILKEAAKNKRQVTKEIASLKRKSAVDFSSGVDTSPCILPSSIKNKNKWNQ